MTFLNDKIALDVKNAFDPLASLLEWRVDKKCAETKPNILAETFELIFTCQKTTGQIYVKKCFVKSPYHAENYDKKFVGPVVAKEREMYKNILPAFKKMSGLPLPITKCYYAHEQGAIIMEDLNEKNYKWYNWRRLLDTEHAAFALKELAKFHAISVKIDERSPQILDTVRKYELLQVLAQDENKNVLFGNRLLKLLTRVDPVFVDQNKNRLLKFKENFFKIAMSEGAHRDDSFNVLNHGDFWITNMMFKYDQNGAVDKVKFFDYQFSHWANPTNDLIRFFLMSMDFETFEKHQQHLLEIYLKALLDSLKNFSCNKTYTMEQLVQDIESKFNFWIFLFIWLAPVFFAKVDEFDGDLFAENLLDGENYGILLRKWMPFFIERGFKAPGSKFNAVLDENIL